MLDDRSGFLPLKDQRTFVLVNANGIGIVETNLPGLTTIWPPA
jgi:hypothetical protein